MLGLKNEKPNVMRPDEEPPAPKYVGPLVVIEPEGSLYSVRIDPPLTTGEGEALTYGTKNEAWGQMLAWAEQIGLPILDLTNSKIGARN